MQSIKSLRAGALSISAILFLSILGGCGPKKPILLPDGQQIFSLESFQNDQKKIVTRILQKDSAGKVVAFKPEEYLKIDGFYVVSPGLMRKIADMLVKMDPELADAILKANQ
jgi:predicted small lipoprotein YifL